MAVGPMPGVLGYPRASNLFMSAWEGLAQPRTVSTCHNYSRRFGTMSLIVYEGAALGILVVETGDCWAAVLRCGITVSCWFSHTGVLSPSQGSALFTISRQRSV